MTVYAGYFNRRHHRSGHLFQNRYKSVVCEEEPYLRELVRYIHLNPLRSGIVKKFGELERYPWGGHGVMMGRDRASWQRSGEVLGYFGKGLRKSPVSYGRYMAEGAGQGKRPELSGGGDFGERVLKMGRGERRAPRLSVGEILSRVAKWAGISPVELGSGRGRPNFYFPFLLKSAILWDSLWDIKLPVFNRKQDSRRILLPLYFLLF